ncbi:regulator of G-protein signaling 7 [Anastrepha ludens]|uniref:regulator of G-protein signaling 7 n=1 Tax=Anastrepha ludens TaxID=28586 RepID=UPI0023AF0168|nr:regulator of G-protein signaling 7 [Anastrepha ludens]
MTSEVDKTQTTIVMAAKSAAENVAITNNSMQSEESTQRHHSTLEGVDGVDGIAGTGNANSVTGNNINEAKAAANAPPTTNLATTVTNLKPLELSSVAISIELASEDESSTAATPASGVEASVSITTAPVTPATPATPTTPTTHQAVTPKTPTTSMAAVASDIPTATATDTDPMSPTETAIELVATTTLANTVAAVSETTATAAIKSGSTTTISECVVACNKENSNSTHITTSTATSATHATYVMLVTGAGTSSTASSTAITTPASVTATTASTTKVSFSVNSATISTTSNSTCTSSTNSTSSVTSISAPAAAGGGVTGNGSESGNSASLSVGGSHHHHQHQHHHPPQHQQNSQHGKSSAGSGSGNGGGADGSHNLLLGAKASLTATAISNQPLQRRNEDAPNILVYKKMETIIEKMQAESTGVAVRTVKAFMSKVPSVFTGADLVAWILKNLDVEDVTEALHFAHLLASHGYIFPIDDHQLTVKNDGTFYRFQTPYFWPSNCWEPENTDYAVYLCKRTMQNKTRLELADYEAENLAKLQKMFSRKWEFIFMQAESQSKVAKKRDKLERKVLDSQERAFWDVHRPMPGCVNTTEIDIKKAYRRGGHGSGTSGGAVAKNPVEQVTRVIALRKQKLERRTIKVSKAAEALVAYYEQYNEFDYFITSPELPNPWQTDSTEMWDAERNSKEVPLRRVKRWGFSLRELLNDPVGREQFSKFLEKEYSGENLKFWESVQQMKTLPQSEIKEAIQKIWQEFLAPEAPCPVNVDSKSVELAREAVNAVNGPNRWCFDVAAAHVYHLMKSDSYSRYLRSDMYKDYLNCSRKKIKSIPNLFGVKR